MSQLEQLSVPGLRIAFFFFHFRTKDSSLRYTSLQHMIHNNNNSSDVDIPVVYPLGRERKGKEAMGVTDTCK